MKLSYLELLGHLAATLSFIGVAIYANFHRRMLRRTTRNSRLLYWLIMAASVAFAVTNLGRVFYLITQGPESGEGTLLDLIAESFILFQSLILWYLLASKIVVERNAHSYSVLAIGAHPDDIEIAAGATLAKMHDAGYRINGLVLTHGGQGGNAERRQDEAMCGADFLGLDTVRLLDFADTHLQEQAADLVKAIETMIKEVQPDMILTHSRHDIHQDHQAVHEATLRAARNQTSILCYESPSTTQEFTPSLFVEVCEYIEVKIEAIREHWDQRDKPYMKAEQVRGKLAFRGSQAKVEHAEGFEIMRILSSCLGGI